jgi:hypothetical protein
MKREIHFAMFCLAMLIPIAASSQSFSFSVAPIPCFNVWAPNTTSAVVTSTVPGSTSYNWTVTSQNNFCPPATYTGASVTMTFVCCGNYTVKCAAMNGASVIVTSTQNINMQCPSVSVSTSPNPNFICAGNSGTLTASGAVSYTWTTPIYSVTQSLVVSPTVSTTYWFDYTTSGGCTLSSYGTFCVSPTPTLTVTGPTMVCAGQATTVHFGGASTYTLLPGSITAPSAVLSPGGSTTYTLTGNNSAGCSSTKTFVVIVNPNPTLTVTGNNTMCLGTSTTFTPGGAITYSWSTGATTHTINVIPLSTTHYTVYGTNSFGCTSHAVVTVTVNSGCSDVWPGDANSDGVVSTSDVLEIGLNFSSTGAARSVTGNNYAAHHAANWTGTVSSGKNRVHADCNGDGTVNFGDTVAISANFALTHSFKSSSQNSVPDIRLVANSPAAAGVWTSADIVLGNPSQVTLYGLAFEIGYDAALVEHGSYIVYSPSFLNNGNPQVEFQKRVNAASTIYAATVRTNNNDVTGQGKIGVLHYKVKTGTPIGTKVKFRLVNSEQVENNGSMNGLAGDTLAVTVVESPSGISEVSGFTSRLRVYNESPGRLLIVNDGINAVNVSLTDLSGRKVGSAMLDGQSHATIDNLQAGFYFFTEDRENIATRRVFVSPWH